MGQRKLLNETLAVVREQGDDRRVARILRELSSASRMLGLREEGIKQAREALEILQRLGIRVDQARSLGYSAQLLYSDKQLDAAEEATSQAIHLLPEKGQEFLVCNSHCHLAKIYRSKGEREKAIHHFGVAVGIASAFKWRGQLFWINYDLAELFLGEGKFDDVHAHIKQAKPHVVDDT